MPVLSLTCNHCGAPLSVPEGTRFVTCQFCSSQLEIHQSGNAIYTEVLQAIDKRTAEMAADLGTIKRQNELEQLDREWERTRADLLIRGKNGETSVPTRAGGLAGLVLGIPFGIFWICGAASMGAPWFITLFGVVATVLICGSSVSTFFSAGRYSQLAAEHDERRRRLLRELEPSADGPDDRRV